jgi:hypothetical protein
MDVPRLHHVLLRSQWAKTQGELRATVALLEWDEERYDALHKEVEKFIKKIEDNHLG